MRSPLLIVFALLIVAILAFIVKSRVGIYSGKMLEIYTISYVNDPLVRQSLASDTFVIRDCFSIEDGAPIVYACATGDRLGNVVTNETLECAMQSPLGDHIRGSFKLVDDRAAVEPMFLEILQGDQISRTCGNRPWYWPTR